MANVIILCSVYCDPTNLSRRKHLFLILQSNKSSFQKNNYDHRPACVLIERLKDAER